MSESYKQKTKQFESIILDIQNLYSDTPTNMSMDYSCLIMSNNPYKIVWDLFVLVLLLVISIIIPIRLAFVEHESKEWRIAYYTIDALFFIDIILTFFTSITDDLGVTEITGKKDIAYRYIKSGWFFIDIFAVLPLDLFLQQELELNSLFRFSRIGKLYKLIRMTRLAKVLKIIRSRNTVVSHFAEKMKINSGKERMLFFMVFFMFFLHIFACMWIFLGDMDTDSAGWLKSGMR